MKASPFFYLDLGKPIKTFGIYLPLIYRMLRGLMEERYSADKVHALYWTVACN